MERKTRVVSFCFAKIGVVQFITFRAKWTNSVRGTLEHMTKKGRANGSRVLGSPHDIELNPLICIFSKRRLTQICLESCAKEGFFRHLSPIEPDGSRAPPSLPSMEVLLKLTAAGRLALIALVLHYWTGEIRNLQRRD